MPFVRCRFYTESGEPVRGGCRRKGAGCTFIHPGDSGWDNAPPPSSKYRDRGSDAGGLKSRSGKQGNAGPSGWSAGGHTSTSTTTDTGGNSGGWGGESGWGDGGGWGDGWDTGGSVSTAPVPASIKSPLTVTPREASTLSKHSAEATFTAKGSATSNEQGGPDGATSSGWGNTGNDGWGESSWGSAKDVDNPAPGSGKGTNSGNTKDANKERGESAWNGWGTGWGGDNNTTNSWIASDSMAVDNQAEETEQRRGKGKAVPPPPRIRIPDNGKKNRITGTNNEPLGSSRWGGSRSSNPATTSTPVAASTPVTTLTPTDSSRLKRKRDAAPDEKIDAFKEYIKAWERAVRARFLLAEAEGKRDRWFRTQKSICYARIGEAGRNRLDDERTKCDKEVNLQLEKLSYATTSLVNFHDTLSSNLDLGQRYNIGEQADKFIKESKVFVDQVCTLLVEHVLKDKNDAQSDDTRKHLSEGNASLFDSLRSQVQDLEERFNDTQTLLTLRHDRDIRSDVNELLTTKIETLREARQREIDRIASRPRPEIVIPPSTLEKIEGTAKQVEELDAKIPQTVEDIRVLLLRVDATTRRVGQLEQELSVNKATYSKQMQAMAAEKQEMERRVDERLEKIREQFQQLVAWQSPAPAEHAAMSSSLCDKMIDSLRPAFETLSEEFYKQEVLPTLGTLQQVVIQASDHHQEEAIKILWGKIQPAMNMVAGVSRWLDSQELGLTAPVEADDT